MTTITTAVGRIVWGNPIVAKQRRDDDNKPKVKVDGSPDMVYSFGFAVDKASFASGIWPVMAAEAQGVFPNGQVPADFSYKFVDGDGVDKKGIPYSKRVGYPGCYVLAIESNFPIRCVQQVSGSFQDFTQIKTGDYVAVNLDIVGHGVKPGVRMSKSGLYLNPRMICFVGYGEEISNGPDAEAIFGGAQFTLPPGASATPVGPTALPVGVPGGIPGLPTASAGISPAHDFVANAAGMPAVGAPGLPGMPAVGAPGLPGMPAVGAPGLPGMPATSAPGLPGMPR